MHKVFAKVADKKRNDADFAHTFAPEVLQNYKFENVVVLFRPSHLHAKFEDPFVVMKDLDENEDNIDKFIDNNQYVSNLLHFYA